MSDPEVRLAAIRQRRAAIGEVNWTYRPDLDPDGPKNIVENARVLEDGWVEEDSIVAYDEGTIDDETGRFIAHAPDDIDWLLGEVSDRRTDLAIALTQLKNTIGEVERLRSRLRELEWPQPIPGGSLGPGIHCPICGNVREQGHEPDCWLAKELRSI